MHRMLRMSGEAFGDLFYDLAVAEDTGVGVTASSYRFGAVARDSNLATRERGGGLSGTISHNWLRLSKPN